MIKQTGLFLLGVLASTAVHSALASSRQDDQATAEPLKRVTGIGGIFFKCEHPEAMRAWYGQHLGFATNPYGSMFEFRPVDAPDHVANLQWSVFPATTKYFEPSTKPFMINYRVAALEPLLERLVDEGVEVVGDLESTPYGKFAHVLDPEGNKIELWEPVDEVRPAAKDAPATR